jgi:hypothetical protein
MVMSVSEDLANDSEFRLGSSRGRVLKVEENLVVVRTEWRRVNVWLMRFEERTGLVIC